MNPFERTELAKAYVALSNAHQLSLILPMFTEQSIYHSVHTGEFKGRDAIGKMMGDFFSRYPDVCWRVPEYRSAGSSAMEFEFVMTATEALTGKRLERKGTEQIEFSDEGFIVYLEVR
jgi:hypothetical protein